MVPLSVQLWSEKLYFTSNTRYTTYINVMDMMYMGTYLKRIVTDMCSNLESLLKPKFYVDLDKDKRFEKVLMHMWTEMVGNCSIYTRFDPRVNQKYFKYCDQYQPGKTVGLHQATWKITEYQDTFYNMGFRDITNPYSDLRFLSCGKRVYSPLAFSELTNIFNPTVWFAFSLSSLTIFVFFKILDKPENVLMFLIKMVFEQGNPVPQKLLKHTATAVPVIIILLVATVLTNAYKNTNVYNMVLPRIHIPYTRLSELIRDQFQIYSGAYCFDILFHQTQFKKYIENISNIVVEKHRMYVKSGKQLREVQAFSGGGGKS